MLNLLLTTRNVGVNSKPPRNSRIEIVSPGPKKRLGKNESPLTREGEKVKRRTSHGCSIHNLELGCRLAFIILIRYSSSRFDGYFHMLDLDPGEEEMDFADDHVFEEVSRWMNRLSPPLRGKGGMGNVL